MKNFLFRKFILIIDKLWLGLFFRYINTKINPSVLRNIKKNKKLLNEFKPKLEVIQSQIKKEIKTSKGTALFISVSGVKNILFQLPIIKAVLLTGLEPIILLPSKASKLDKLIYELCGIKNFDYWSSKIDIVGYKKILKKLKSCSNQEEVLKLKWKNISIGKYALSSLMRKERIGQIDLNDKLLRNTLYIEFENCFRHANISKLLFKKWTPKLVVLIDRGYTPEGTLFDEALNKNVKAISFCTGHKDNTLILKKFDYQNRISHPVSLSQKSWNNLKKSNWNDTHWNRLKKEFETCYDSGEWYGEVATQFGTKRHTKEQLIDKLKLNPKKKTILFFPHIFWDATFFFGKDIFKNYEDWYLKTFEMALKNKNVNWIIKIHPANIVKNIRDNVNSQYSEISSIKKYFPLPNHIKFLEPDTDISTLSLYQCGDICLTVRGTVGIEASSYGIRVITVGDGRYDGYGFTLDVKDKAKYLKLLNNIHNVKKMTKSEILLARKHAFGIFLLRPLKMETINYFYQKNREAFMEIAINDKYIKSFKNAPDISLIKEWLNSNNYDFINKIK